MGRTASIILTGLLGIAGTAGAFAAVESEAGKAGAKDAASHGASGLKRFDADRDQAVTLDEFLKRRVEAFTKRDKSGEGILYAAELGQAPLGFRKQRQDRRMERMLVRLDTNSDGKLTKAEFDAAPAAAPRTRRAAQAAERREMMFAFYDRNGDSVVEKAEYEAGRAEELDYDRRRRLHALDRDGDGKVTLEEYTADARFRFMRLDIDRDGRITAADRPPFERQRWSLR
jgi:Ca2+-binding EF-hand superfamily protein